MPNLPIVFHVSAKILRFYPSKPSEIEDMVANIYSEVKQRPKLTKFCVAMQKVDGAELKVGGAAAPPTV